MAATDSEILAGIHAALATGDMVTFTPTPQPPRSRTNGTTCEWCNRALRADGELWPTTDLRGRGCWTNGTQHHFRAFAR